MNGNKLHEIVKIVLNEIGRYQPQSFYKCAIFGELTLNGFTTQFDKSCELKYKNNIIIGNYTFDLFIPDTKTVIDIHLADENFILKELETFKNKFKLAQSELNEAFFINLDSKGSILVTKININI